MLGLPLVPFGCAPYAMLLVIAMMLSLNIFPEEDMLLRLIAIDGIRPYLAAIQANDHFWNKGKKITKNKISQPTWCEVCQINCNSSDVYAKHLSGKNHLKNLQNLEKSNNSTCYSSSIDTDCSKSV